MTTLSETDALTLAREWIQIDPDPADRAEAEALLDAAGDELIERFRGHLGFGTAGLRGALGAGPQRMNRVLVRVVAAALAERLGDEDLGDAGAHVVIGYDARHRSLDFARDTARVLAARGVRATLLPGPQPTPVLAFAVRHFDAAAGVMVTASHNPRSDNGYKVYWRGGAQITPPIDREISALIDALPLLGDDDLAPLDHPHIAVAGDDIAVAYIEAATSTLDPAGSRTARVAYTPLHGVGGDTVLRAFAAAGFDPPMVVPEQAVPDPDFPTTAFPNPEEPGVLDGLLRVAAAGGCDVALANDPDADRLAVAVPNGSGWLLLTGDEVGTLLAEHLLGRGGAGDALVVNSIVSSRLLVEIARHHQARSLQVLTGFKWIMRAREDHPDLRFVLGYEEALGYAVGDAVRDKDGISAALVVAQLVGDLAAQGRTLLDLRDDIHRRHGVHVTGQRSIRFEATPGPSVMDLAMQELRAHPPAQLAGRPVTAVVDLAEGRADLPPTDGVILELDGARVVVRPSGTEPKMKVYGEVVTPATADIAGARAEARAALTVLLGAAVGLVASPERAPAPDPDDSGDDEISTRADALAADLPAGQARARDLRTIVRCIDLTTLSGDDTPGRVRSMCAQALRPDPADPTVGPVAAVCLYPSLIPLATELTGDSPVRVASVAGAFPSGLSDLEVRLADINHARASGADEIDIVLNRSALLAGRLDEVRSDLEASIAAARPAHCKVIIEVGELITGAAIRTATRLAIDAGADTVKTSTGKIAVNATPFSVLVIAECVAEHARRTGAAVGIKVSGGVRTADDALGYVAIVRSVLGDDWITPERFRFGASSLLDDVLADLAVTEGRARERSAR